VKIANDQVLKITTKYNSLLLKDCVGRSIVPGIQIGVNEHIDLHSTNFIQFYGVEENFYNGRIMRINFREKLLVSHKIRIARLMDLKLCENIGPEFKYGCETLLLFNTNGVIISLDNKFKKIILSHYYQNFLVYYLSYSIYEVVISSCYIDHHILVFGNSTKKIRFYRVNFGNSVVKINHECENIIIKKTIGSFVISNIIRKSSLHGGSLYLHDGVFIFENDLFKTQHSLLLKRVVIGQRTIVRENVNVVNLISVVIRKRAVLKINDDCEILLIDNCDGNLDFSGCTCLKSLTIKNYKFIYHKNIYDNLLSLHLEGLNINTTIRLEENIKTVKLMDVTTGWFGSAKIVVNYEEIYVRNFVGNLDISNLFDCFKKLFTGKTITIAYEMISDKFGRTMFFNNICLEKDYEIPNDVESVILRNFKTNGKAKLKINKTCKYFKLNVYQGCIDVSKMKDIKEVVFIGCLPIFKDNS
ncbi:putative LRR containing protein, partial [Trachipleistophora hominis]